MSDSRSSAAGRDTRSSARRRRLLQALAGAGAAATVLPDRWLKPIVNSVVVPVHAQSTPPCVTDFLEISVQARWEVDGDTGDNIVTLAVDLGPGGGVLGSADVDDSDGSFNDEMDSDTETCPNGGDMNSTGTFSGTLNLDTGAISGSFAITVTCGSAEFCTVSGDFSGTLVVGAEIAEITLTNVTQECCDVPPV